MPENGFVIILMGSPSDRGHCEQITGALESLGVAYVQHIASAHKTPRRLLELLEGFENDPRPHVYVTVAGRSNAISGMVDASVTAPVIACPPQSSSFGGADVYSSLRMPSGVAPMLVLEPANAALAAAKILALGEADLARRVRHSQQAAVQRLIEADRELQAG